MNFLFWLVNLNWWTSGSNWWTILLLLLAPQGFLIYIWEPKIYLQICFYYYGNFQQTSDIHHPSTVLLQHVQELHSTCSNICKVHSQCTVCTVNMHQSTVKHSILSSKHSLHSQYAQSAPCVPVPDHMLCYPFHVIGYWRKSKPILPKYSIQNAIWDNRNKIFKSKPS